MTNVRVGISTILMTCLCAVIQPSVAQSEFNVAYEAVTGAAWQEIQNIKNDTDTFNVLNNVERGLVLVNAFATASVKNNGNGVAVGGVEILWRLGRSGDLKSCTTNRDVSNKITLGTFAVSSTCVIPIDVKSDVTIVVRPRAQGANLVQRYEARYMAIRTKKE
jgi:hypothetical protein